MDPERQIMGSVVDPWEYEGRLEVDLGGETGLRKTWEGKLVVDLEGKLETYFDGEDWRWSWEEG